jgi:hypothetical protein
LPIGLLEKAVDDWNDMISQKLEQWQLESEEGLDLAQHEIYPDATVKVSRDQYSVFELIRMIEKTHELQLVPPPLCQYLGW